MRILLLMVVLLFGLPAHAGLSDYDVIHVFGANNANGSFQFYDNYIQGPSFTQLLQNEGYRVQNHARHGNSPIQGMMHGGIWLNGWIDWRRSTIQHYWFLKNQSMQMPGGGDLAIVLFGGTVWVSPAEFRAHLTIFTFHLYQMGAERVVLLTPPPRYQYGRFDPIVAGNAAQIRILWKSDPLFYEGPDLYLDMQNCMGCWMPYSRASESYGPLIDARGHALIADQLLRME